MSIQSGESSNMANPTMVSCNSIQFSAAMQEMLFLIVSTLMDRKQLVNYMDRLVIYPWNVKIYDTSHGASKYTAAETV